MKIEGIFDQKTIYVNEVIIITFQYHEGFPENQKHFCKLNHKHIPTGWKKVKGVATKHYSG